MSSICHSYILVCQPYFTRTYSYVIRMSPVCTRMPSACHSYVFVCHPYITSMYSYVICMSLVFISNVIRMPLVCTCMSSVCHSCVYWYVIRMSLVCGFTMNRCREVFSEKVALEFLHTF